MQPPKGCGRIAPPEVGGKRKGASFWKRPIGTIQLLVRPALHGGGLGGQILAQIQLGKLLVLRQDDLIGIQRVELERQRGCAQSQNVTALRPVAAEEVEVPARHAESKDPGA